MDTSQQNPESLIKKALSARVTPRAKSLAPATQTSPATALQRTVARPAADGSSPSDLLTLQQTVGNRATTQLLAQPRVQLKAVSPDRLNVVGENHGESGKR